MNQTAHYDFTIVVPVYNEEESLSSLEEVLGDYLPHALYKACVLLVDDGSSDHSLERIIDICRRRPSFFYLSLTHNSGLSAAMKAGIDATHSPFVGYMDADLQTVPEDFNLLLVNIARCELSMGIRLRRQDSFFKIFQSMVANRFRRMMTHDGVADTGCPLKVMRTEYAQRIPFFTGMHRFLPALIQLQGGRVEQTVVRHLPRAAGKSKYHLWNRLVSPFLDCFAYRWMKKRYIRYQVGETNLTA
ncbi:MAG: glycosyltransferase [Bacteroides sp.]